MANRWHNSPLLSVLLIATCSFTSSFHHPLPVGRAERYVKRLRPHIPQASNKGVRLRRHLLFAENINNPIPDFGSSSHISYYDPTRDIEEATAAIKQGVLDRAVKFSEIEFTDTRVAENMEKVQTNLKAVSERLSDEAEIISKTTNDLVNYISEGFSAEGMQRSSNSFSEFSQYYFSALESKYRFSEIMTGKTFEDAMVAITTASHDLFQALDLKQNGSIILLIVAFFWGAEQRNAGLEKGKKIGEEQIKRMEIELQSAKATVREKNTVESDEVKELRLQMEALQAKVEALTAVTQKVTDELAQARKLSVSTATIESPKEVSITPSTDMPSTKVESASSGSAEKALLEVPEAPPKAGNTKAPSKVKESKKKATKKAPEDVPVDTPQSSQQVQKSPSAEPTNAGDVSEEPSAAKSPDWGRFSESTLKRKTVKELTGYLAEKGVDCTDDDGKPLKKDSLVELVLST